MAGKNSSLDTVNFAGKTPIGGRYDWDFNVFGKLAAVSVTNVTITTAQFERFDATFDDGDLTTGQYRGDTGRYSFILQLSN